MKKRLQTMEPPAGAEARYGLARRIWLIAALTLLGCCVGVLALMFGATAYTSLPGGLLFRDYFADPLLLFLNLLPPVLLIWLFYFMSRRAWVGFLGSFLPVVGVALVNYFKIQLRSDPFLAADLRLAAEAGGIVGNYTLELNWLVWFALLCLGTGLVFASLFLPRGAMDWRSRSFGAASCLALLAVSFPALFLDPALYEKTDHFEHINRWSDVEVFSAKGCVYPFLYSFRDMFPTPPEGYDRAAAAQLLGQYQDTPIPEDKKVSVMGIMLEAFSDFTDFEILAGQEGVARVYAPWHELEARSVTGDLLTNIFAGGTVDTEWAFLTGYTQHDDFRKNTDSYVWYLRDQGYRTFGSHPGYGWFYNRQNVNRYLGFEDYWFTEDHYGELVSPDDAIRNSDHVLAAELLAQMKEEAKKGPSFSFSVSYQNHGPYEFSYTAGESYLTPESSGLGQDVCNLWNNYLNGIADTIDAVLGLVRGLEEMEEPVVLVLFGDHKPTGGSGRFAYYGLGLDFDLSTEEGFTGYYSTPYLIWANPAAKAALGRDFVGEGGDFSPSFLMTEVFDQCGWEGPGFMELSRQVREVTPLIHTRGLYWREDGLTDALPQEEGDFLRAFLSAQYYRENEVRPQP